MLFGIAANKRLYAKHHILSIAVHPGVIQTELGRYAAPETREAIQGMRDVGMIHCKTLGAGAATSLVAATDPMLGMPEGRKGMENWEVI